MLFCFCKFLQGKSRALFGYRLSEHNQSLFTAGKTCVIWDRMRYFKQCDGKVSTWYGCWRWWCFFSLPKCWFTFFWRCKLSVCFYLFQSSSLFRWIIMHVEPLIDMLCTLCCTENQMPCVFYSQFCLMNTNETRPLSQLQ